MDQNKKVGQIMRASKVYGIWMLVGLFGALFGFTAVQSGWLAASGIFLCVGAAGAWMWYAVSLIVRKN